MKRLLLNGAFATLFSFFFPSLVSGQIIETETSQSGWVTIGLPPYTSGTWNDHTAGGASGRYPATTSLKMMYIPISSSGISPGTYNVDVRWYDANSETSSLFNLQIGQRSCYGTSTSVCHSGNFRIDDEWTANATAGTFSMRPTYANVIIQPDDTIFYYLKQNGGSPRGWIDYIQFTPLLPNTNPPVIHNQSFNVNENSPGGTIVGSVVATEPDAGQSVVAYSIIGGNTNNVFSINNSGVIIVSGSLNYETTSIYSLNVQACDDGTPMFCSSAIVTINISDVSESTNSLFLWNGACSGTTVSLLATVSGATFAGWERSEGGITYITNPSSASTTITNHTTTATFVARAVIPTGPNGVTNGDFEAGNTVTGFSSSYSYRSASVTGPGQFGITQNADVSQSYFVSSPDHTPSGFWYLYADGSNTSGAVVYQTTVMVTNGTSYAFSAWFANGHDGTVNSNETAHLEFRVGGAYTGDIFLPLNVGVWNQFTSAFTATTSGPITISIVNRNTNSTKNDFFLDDIVFQEATLLMESITVPACPDPLPVKLIYFKGEFKDGVITLSWSTSTEIENSYFVVERSENGIDFFPIGKIAGKGNSSVFEHYMFEDFSPLNGWHYYRLKQVDHNEDYFYSDIVAIENKSEFSILAYPNPSNGTFYINVVNNKHDQHFTLEVIDSKGSLIYVQKGVLQPKIEVMELKSGMYVIRITVDQKIHSEKVWVN